VEKRQQLLLNVPYFLVTFTLPAELRQLARSHQKTVYNILIKSAANTVLELMESPWRLDGMVGILSVLQTWTRDLRYHPHVHMLVTGGALSNDGKHWHRLRYPYLVAQRVLSDVFAGKFLHAMKKAKLHINVRLPRKRWVIDVLAVGSGQAALRYLAPYIFRVAISNRRIVSLQGKNVTFLYKDSKTKQERFAVLTVNDFIHRFLQHVLPHRFIKVRTYGLFSPRHKHLLQKAKLIVGLAKPQKENNPISLSYPRILACPDCKNPMQYIGEMRRTKVPETRPP